MPSKNTIKNYDTYSYYHVYNRGVDKQKIFKTAADKAMLMKILRRHLDPLDKSLRSDMIPYRKLNDNVELLAYCLMGNHYHMLFYIKDDRHSLSVLLQSVFTAYTMYYNKKHKRVGTLFQGVYKASKIIDESYLLHITRYIHMNPRYYKTYAYSSIGNYLGSRKTTWVNHARCMDLFEGDDYMAFLEDYEDRKATLEHIKDSLANCK